MGNQPNSKEQENVQTSEEVSNGEVHQEKEDKSDFDWGDGLNLQVGAGEMKATLELSMEHHAHYTPEDLVRFLEQQNIVHKIDRESIQSIFDQKLFNTGIVVAKGTPPQSGQNGRVEWEIDLSILDGAQLVERGGRVDWKERHHVLPVKQDQLLARLVEPTEGEPGLNVYGKELPATPGKEAKLTPGKGMRISEDGKEMYAELSGVVCREGSKISIVDTYSVNGDVNLETGNIHYDETVMISGGVLTDFKVHAGQDVHVNGLVEGATIEAKGNLYLLAGIQGNDKAIIKANGDITTKFINNANVVAGGSIFVEGAITHSSVKAYGKVVLGGGKKAVILGGRVSAELEIVADVIGSEFGAKTLVVVGEELRELQEQKTEKEQKLESLKENYQKTKQALQSYESVKRKGKVSKKQEALYLKLVRFGMQLQGQIKQLQTEIQGLDGQVEKDRINQKGVIVQDTIWPGTTVQIMNHKYPIQSPKNRACFTLVGSEIEIRSIT